KQRSWHSSWRSLVPISTAGDGPSLFLIHGAEGNVLLYRVLAQKLGRSRPVYGLQSRGLDGAEPPSSDIETMAGNYIREIKSVQPEGPYFLCGYCLGGTIALEIAQQLRKNGDDVALLAMIETYNLHHAPPVSGPMRAWHLVQNLGFHAANFLLSLKGG